MSVVAAQQPSVFAGLETLEPRQLLAATPAAVTTTTEAEANDRYIDANSFVMPTTGGVKLKGRFQSDNDRDLFTFIAPKSGKMLVSLTQLQFGYPQMIVKEPGGRKVLRIDPATDATFDQFRVEVGQEYVIQFNKSSPLGPNQYAATFRFNQGGARDRGGSPGRDRDRRVRINPGVTQTILESELNNSKNSADEFTVQSASVVSVLRGQSNNTRDRDFFTFRAPRSGTMRFAVKSLNSSEANPRPTYLKVFDKFGTIVGDIESKTNGKLDRFDGIVDQGQTYFVLARAREFKLTFYQVNMRYREVF